MQYLFLFFWNLYLHMFSMAYTQPAKDNPVDWVNVFIGTGGHGHTYPGATVPFGMVQLSPDTRLEGWDGCSGYHYSDGIIYGFSHTHLSGTGVADYADILLQPTNAAPNGNNGANGKPGYRSKFEKSTEKASPGKYEVYLRSWQVKVDLTATAHCGFHKYRFDEPTFANIIIDLAHRDKALETNFELINDSTIAGKRISQSWADKQEVYFYMVFSKPYTRAIKMANGSQLGDDAAFDTQNKQMAFEFDLEAGQTVEVKVGISAVDIEGAKNNMLQEIGNKTFDQIANEARQTWNNELSKIEVKGGNKEDITNFYTALYHCMIVPNIFSDVDMRYRGMDGQIHRSKDDHYTVFSLWDTYRAEHPLLTIIDQKRTADFINNFIDMQEQSGLLPVWELAANETNCMIGYHSVSVIADAYFKKVNGFNANKAMNAMLATSSAQRKEIKDYVDNGYLSGDIASESVSKTLEYAYDDWCIAQMAQDLGLKKEYENYNLRAQSWKNVMDPYSKFMRAKMNGIQFEPFDPAEVNFNFTEANSWQYSFYVPHDIQTWIQYYGGKDQLDNRLDNLFTASSKTSGREQADITGLIGQYAHGNEPSHHIAYLFNYIGKPAKTQDMVREIMQTMYSPQPDGLSGNEDCGQMSAWYVMSAMGFYAVTPGNPVYTIGSPLFEEVIIHLENGKTFSIKAHNNSNDNRYIQSATLNGKPYNQCYLSHFDIMKGGEMVYEMDNDINLMWGLENYGTLLTKNTGKEIVPVPSITASSLSFKDSLWISIDDIVKDATLEITLNGRKHVKGSKILLKQSTVVTAKAKIGEEFSQAVTAKFYKIDPNVAIKVKPSYAPQYAAGGDYALIDKRVGGDNFRTGTYQGYQGLDVEMLVDLGSVKNLSSVQIGSLQDIRSWIWLPLWVNFEVSEDGLVFNQLEKVESQLASDNYNATKQNFKVQKTFKSRYIKITAKNQGNCPEWHLGAGNPSWIFLDEISWEFK